MSKVPCGGFELDDSLEIRDGKLSAKSALDAKQDKTFIITFTVDEDGTNPADKTFDELSTAISEGKSILAVIKNKINSITYYAGLLQFLEGTAAVFSFYQIIPNQSVTFTAISIGSDNNVIKQDVPISLA